MWCYLATIITLFFCVVSAQNVTDCVCVPYYQCRKNGTVITDGEGIIDERLGASCQQPCSCEGIEVCCSLPKTRTRNPSLASSCGYVNPDGIGFKLGVGGTDALLGEFPWMVQIFEDGKYRCGGSLIHPSVVLTAAHCVKLPNSTYTVRAGEYDTSNTNEILKHQDGTVESIKIHEDFRPKIYYNDIALVFLTKPFELQPHINVACLIPEDTTLPTKTRCIATGWGNKKYGPNENGTSVLKEVDLPLINRPECEELLRETRLGKYFNLHHTFICAGGEKDKDTCIGDGGGPLICPIEGQENRFQQVGITAWGLECNYENIPGVYANIAVLRKWIDEQMKAKKLDVIAYKY